VPNISIILTTYNGQSRGFLIECIESVLNQTYTDFECLIIDDGSIDNTNLICANYLNDKRFKYHYQFNRGLAAARNTGLDLSYGNYICFLDDDDIWYKDKLQKQIDFFEKNKSENIGMIFTNIHLINKDGKKIGEQANYADGNIYDLLLYKNLIDSPSSVMIKKSIFKEVGDFKEWMKSSEDYDLWIRISKKFKIFSINEFLVKYRMHDNKMSLNHTRMDFYTLLAIFYATEGLNNDKIEQIYLNQYQNIFNKYFDLGNIKEARKYYYFYLGNGNFNFKMFFKYILLFIRSLYN
jgi:glycosyltransferase involved in cell wall biosynthesis